MITMVSRTAVCDEMKCFTPDAIKTIQAEMLASAVKSKGPICLVGIIALSLMM